MTYREDYMNSKTLKELEDKVNSDLIIARMINSEDRIKIIKQTAEEVANMKFK